MPPRLRKRKAPDTPNGSDIEDDAGSDFERPTTTKKKAGSQKKKVKDSTGNKSSTKGQPLAKRPRGARGSLGNIVEMPIDVLFEIFGNLLPIDLWNLARTTKDLRSILMSSTSASVWRQTRANDPHNLPDCPSDVSEPEFAALCYAKHCTTCLRVTPSPYYFWAVRVRLCRKCVDEECVAMPREIQGKLSTFMPWVVLPGRGGLVVPRTALTSFLKAFQKEKNKSPDVLLTKAWVKAMSLANQHAALCQQWLERRNLNIETGKEAVADQRREEILAYASTLGWSDGVLNDPFTTKAFKDLSIVTKACHKKITAEVLTQLKPALNTFFGECKEELDKRELSKKLKDRLPLLKEVRDECVKRLPPNIPVITTRDLFHLPEVHSIIVDTPNFTREQLAPISENFEHYAEEWQNHQKDILRNLVKAAHDTDHIVGQGDILDLATVSLRCSECYSYQFLRTDRALAHEHCFEIPNYYWPTVPTHFKNMTKEEAADITIVCTLAQRQWRHNILSFPKASAKFLATVVEICGLDPKTATADEMDDLNIVIECLSCNDVHKGRSMMTWDRTYGHASRYHGKRHHSNHRGPTMKVRLLEGPELSSVRLRMQHKTEKALSSELERGSLCASCRFEGNLPDLKAHWKQVHKRAAADGDILCKLDSTRIVGECTYWPPLDPEEVSTIQGSELTLDDIE